MVCRASLDGLLLLLLFLREHRRHVRGASIGIWHGGRAPGQDFQCAIQNSNSLVWLGSRRAGHAAQQQGTGGGARGKLPGLR